MSNCFRDNTNASSVVDNENWMLDARVNIKIGQTSRSPYQARSIERGMTEMQMEYSRIGRPRLITYRDNCSSAPERPERNKPPILSCRSGSLIRMPEEQRPEGKKERKIREEKKMSTSILNGMRKHVANTYNVCIQMKSMVCARAHLFQVSRRRLKEEEK